MSLLATLWLPRGRVALQTGMHSPWVSRLLSELGHEVILAHARKVRLDRREPRKDNRLEVGINRNSRPKSPTSCGIVSRGES
jgi:hypothetical protein